MTVPGPPAVDLSDPASFVAGVPHEHFARLRAEAPVSWQPRADGSGFWSVVRHADIEAAEKDPARFSNRRGINIIPLPEEIVATMSEHMLIWNDPPRHTFLRRIINRGFTPRAVAALEDAIRTMASDSIDAVIERGECDFVEVAASMPVEVIAELLGVPEHDRPKLFGWANAVFGAEDPECSDPQRMALAMMEMFAYARRLAARRRREPGDDLISVIATATEGGESLSELDVAVFFPLLAIAGNETTRTLILHAQLLMIEHPEVAAELRADPALVPAAVEELLRYVTPVHGFGRSATEDCEIAGQRIAAGDQVVLWYASGNRDETVFCDPDRLDIHRTDGQAHQAFGARGPHHCLGASLARLEVQILLPELLRRLPDIELAGPVARLRSNFVNGIKRMPVRFTPGPAMRPASARPVRPPMTIEAVSSSARSRPARVATSPAAGASAEAGAPIELVHLATATLEVAAPLFLADTPKGTRVVAEITSSRWEGERLRAKQIGAASADWALIGADGTAALDIRTTLETDDGALILVQYQGRGDYSRLDLAPIYAAPLFETGDERYRWLNKVQAIARGRTEGMERIVYEVYEVR